MPANSRWDLIRGLKGKCAVRHSIQFCIPVDLSSYDYYSTEYSEEKGLRSQNSKGGVSSHQNYSGKLMIKMVIIMATITTTALLHSMIIVNTDWESVI